MGFLAASSGSAGTLLSAAERVRQAIQRLVVATKEGELPRVTVSMGVAQLTEGDSVASLLKAADEAMYRAKRTGRNQVVLSER